MSGLTGISLDRLLHPCNYCKRTCVSGRGICFTATWDWPSPETVIVLERALCMTRNLNPKASVAVGISCTGPLGGKQGYLPIPAAPSNHKYTYIYRVPQCMSPRRNCNSPTPSLASHCAPLPGTGGWGGGILACGWGVGGVPIPKTGEKLSTLPTLCSHHAPVLPWSLRIKGLSNAPRNITFL